MPSICQVLSCDEAVLMKAVSHRPVIVAVDAYCDDFQVTGGHSSNHNTITKQKLRTANWGSEAQAHLASASAACPYGIIMQLSKTTPDPCFFCVAGAADVPGWDPDQGLFKPVGLV